MTQVKEPYYPRPSVTADLFVFTYNDKIEMQVLLIKRGDEPFKGAWALPGGFVDLYKKETVIEAAVRELKEETNIDCSAEKLQFYGFFDAPGRDPREREDGDYRTISFGYALHVPNPEELDIKAMDDAAEYRWASVKDCIEGREELAFDHREEIQAAWKTLS